MLSDVRNYRLDNKNNMLEESCAGLYEWLQIHDGTDINNMTDYIDELVVIKYVIKPERTHIVITTKHVLELMNHKDLQAVYDTIQKLLMNRWPFIAFGVVDKHRYFHPTGCLFTNKVDIDAYVYLMSGMSEYVDKLFHMPPDVKDSLNDNDDAIFKGFKLVFPLASPGSFCVHMVAMSMPKNRSNASLMIQRALGTSTTI